MKKREDPSEELRKKLFDIEVALHLMQQDIDEIAIKLTALNKLQKDLIYNIELHRSGTVTTSMSEYRLVIKDLEKTRGEIQRFLNLQVGLEKKLIKLTSDHDIYNKQYELYCLSLEESKVLQMSDYAKNNKRKRNKEEN